MKNRIIPPESLLTRRRFCQGVGVGVVTIALPACFGGNQRVGVGGIDDTDLGGTTTPPDLARVVGPPPDLAGHDLVGYVPPDMSVGKPLPDLAMNANPNACMGGVFNTNRAPGAFAVNTATYFSSQDAFVCRDANGLFALSSICTHAGCTLKFQAANNDRYYCNCHGATFSYTGAVTGGPTFTPLDHYAMCIQQDGNVGFDVNTVVNKNTRLVA